MNIGLVISLIKKLAPAADPETIEAAVQDWLDDHPEATTTVEDGSVTEAKLASALAAIINGTVSDVTDLKNAIEDNLPETKPSDAEGVDLDVSDENGNVLARFDGGHIKTKNFNSRAVTPKIVKVAKDGSGDFMTVRDAVDSITDASSAEKPYVIEIYPGTYNVFEDYTQEEIETAGTGSYIQDGSGFVGILLNDGISLRGVGNRDEIILKGELSTETYVTEMRNNIATLNLRDTNSLENLTVVAKNIRYCVHDDFYPTIEYVDRNVKNCVFRGFNLTSGNPGPKTWGEGSRQGKRTVLEDCDFGSCMLWHTDNQSSAIHPSELIVKNCTAFYASISCSNHSVMNNVHLYGNHFAMVLTNFANVSSTNKMMTMDGTDRGEMILSDPTWNYTNGDIVKFPIENSSTIAVGQLVTLGIPYWASGSVTPVTDPATAYGVVVGKEETWLYVQTGGYILADRVGLSNLAVGDRITADANGMLEANGSGETFGVVIYVSQDYGTYIRRV